MRIKKYDVVRHFKFETLTETEKLKNVYTYQILNTDVLHTETAEHLIVYKSLYDGHNVSYGQIFARPLEMFLSEVDHVKYPNIKQKYRFETISHNDKEI